MKKFSKPVLDNIGWYVYFLKHPGTKNIFYVGKGQENRVFDHLNEKLLESEFQTLPAKYEIIRKIRDCGLEVEVVIHRHKFPSEEIAYEVEAALIDSISEISNIQGGRGSHARGPMSPDDIEAHYAVDECKLRHNCLMIDISKSYGRRSKMRASLLDACRFAWRLSLKRASSVDYVLAHDGGIVRGVFKPREWLPATKFNFPEFADDIPRIKGKRIGFVGENAESSIEKAYKNKLLPKRFRMKARNPCRYSI